MTIDKFIKVFIGKNEKKYSSCQKYGSFIGNSILIEIKPLEYIYVGDNITNFTTIEPIISYHSVMGNSDTVYPFAFTTNYVYVMLGFEYTEKIKGNPDPYPSFYNHNKNNNNEYQTKWKKTKHKI